MDKNANINESKNRALSLYKYLKDLSSLRIKTVSNINAYDWSCYFKNIPDDPENITVTYRDRVSEEETFDNRFQDEIISVKKPEFQKCPSPPKLLDEWLNPGWDLYFNNASIKNSISKNEEVIENFGDDSKRVDEFAKWIKLREEWQEKQIKTKETRDFFNKLYHLHVDLNREAEVFELVIGNGFITLSDNKNINHPILLKRITTEFDAENNIIRICDTETDPELYTSILNDIEDLNLSTIKEVKNELKEKYYHPIDRNDAYDFLKVLIHKLSSRSKFIKNNETIITNADDKIYLQINPVIFKRKRTDGTIKTLEEIIRNIEKTGFIPAHIIDIVKGGKIEPIEENIDELSIDELLAATSGESQEILLSKEANKEQLEIAKRIEKYNAVCVQGPPGTGKTHTIANLLGHFLAQGKNVLVTSHTPKALRVLKDKVSKGIQNLCVTVLDDRNIDMEQSIDGISEYLSKYTSFELLRKMQNAKLERKEIMSKLAGIRKKIYAIKNKEFEPIVFNGESYSPAKAAYFVSEHAEELSYIPGKVELNKLIPLTTDELVVLYQSNVDITNEDDNELDCNLPNPSNLYLPAEFTEKVRQLKTCKKAIEDLENNLNITLSYKNNKVILNKDDLSYTLIENPNVENLEELLLFISELKHIEEWMIYAIVDGNKGPGYKAKWENLVEQIKDTVKFADSFVANTVAKEFNIPEECDPDNVLNILEDINKIFIQKGKLSWFDVNLNKDIKYVLENFKINNKQIASYDDSTLMTQKITLIQKRISLKNCWNFLIAVHGFTKFEDLDKESNESERVAQNFVSYIQKCINWYNNDLLKLQDKLTCMGFNSEVLFTEDSLDTELIKTKKYLDFIRNDIPKYLNISKAFIEVQYIEYEIKKIQAILTEEKRQSSNICNKLSKNLTELNTDDYNTNFLTLSKLYDKYELRAQRANLLKKVKVVAPNWASAIQKREGIHGLSNVPEHIFEAWKWKQLAGIIDEITSQPFEELQLDCVKFNKALRQKTAECCEYNSWYHLLKMTETDLDMRQALQGWKKTIKKIGKGTGKNVPMYRREAKKLMAKCQRAVPAWIMPMNKALETLVPGENLFDVIIIDEASQSDITALSIGYMAKKLIIVGDDKQVSPLAIGTETDKINNLMEMFIKDVIPNSHLYELKTSLYEIAETTFQPLMLKEHFRCVPDIIGFSNRLSYDYKIKPLRDSSSSELLPATISYRVDGQRDGSKKINIAEAKTIVSLILACIENEKYKNSTFGVISLLGREQADYIQSLLLEKIENTLYEKHKILCGDASSFQGDERDVIFLSMVDSNFADGPLSLASSGSGDSRKQRYNVAASRAKDQMWLIHSLDITKDLKEGDLRRFLIEYMQNPNDYAQQIAEIKRKSDSPFEEEVCSALVARGYHIVQQWNVGAYKIDMVAVCENKKIAIECDGNQFHSGDIKIREDMERQTILERIGWRFIRIRGSEYYRDKEKTINRVINELKNNGIEPEQTFSTVEIDFYTETIENIKIRAEQIRNEWKKQEKELLEQSKTNLNNGISEIQTCLF